jgi:hypothetical protein
MEQQQWFTTAEAAVYLRTSVTALKKHVQRGTLRPDAFGLRGGFRGHRYARDTLDAFVRTRVPSSDGKKGIKLVRRSEEGIPR